MTNALFTPQTGMFRRSDLLLYPALVLILLSLYSFGLAHDLLHDELYHMLAAQGLAKTGYPQIANGLYERNLIITWLTSKSRHLPLNPIVSARLPSVALSILTSLLMFLWLRTTTNSLTSWLFLALYCTSPFTIDIAQYVRLYSLQVFTYVAATISLFASLYLQKYTTRTLAVLIGIGSLFLSVKLSYTAVMGIPGLLIWLIAYLLLKGQHPQKCYYYIGTIILVLLLCIVAFIPYSYFATSFAQLWTLYRATPLFGAENAPKFWIYHQWLSLYYPTFWSLTGILAGVGVWRFPVPTTLSLCIFGSSFLFASFAGPKGFRYIAFALPFLFATWGVGLATLVPWIDRAGRHLRLLHFMPRFQLVGVYALLILGVVFILVGNPAWIRAGAMLADRQLPGEVPSERWSLATKQLAALSRTVDVVVATNELAALYYLGRADVTLSKSKLMEADETGREFSVDYRTGLPVVSKAASLEKIIQCNRSGLIVVTPTFMHDDREDGRIREVLESRLVPIKLNNKSGLLAFYWHYVLDDKRCGGSAR